MPIVNGRVHIDRPRLAPHHRVAYGVGIGVAVAVVVAGWIVTVGSQLKTLASSAIEELHATGDTIGVVKEQTSEAFRPVGGAVGEAKNAFVQLIEDANQKKDAAEAVAGLVKDQLAHDAEAATPSPIVTEEITPKKP